MAFYRTVLQVEILSDEPYRYKALSDVAFDIIEGDCSGKTTVVSQEEVSKEQMAELLIAQGSDPSFLLGD